MWIDRLGPLTDVAQQFAPGCKLAVKRSSLWNLTEAGSKDATTIGRTIYIPSWWTPDSVLHVIPHEAEHVAQFKRFGLGLSATLGIPFFLLVYILFPLPILCAWARFYLELGAEAAAWKFALEANRQDPEGVLRAARWFGVKLGGKEYGYAIPKPWAIPLTVKRAEKVIAAHERR